jgi:hypothetical protein
MSDSPPPWPLCRSTPTMRANMDTTFTTNVRAVITERTRNEPNWTNAQRHRA